MNTKLSYIVVCSEMRTDIDRTLTFEVNVLLYFGSYVRGDNRRLAETA